MKKILLLTLTLFYFQVNAQSLEADRTALVKLYNATNGPQWTNSTNWNTPGSPCGWWGITCEGSRVTEINLTNNNLSGTIPIENGEFTELKYLGLAVNKLSGTIPSELSTLSKLEIIELSANQLTGNIPPKFAYWANLRRLSLSSNQLSGSIPVSLYNMPSLQTLDLTSNQLTGSLSNAIGNLTQLQYLELRGNRLTGDLPDSLGYMNTLREINLIDNMFTGSIPASFANLASIENLFLTNNLLGGLIPAEIGNLKTLVRLWFSSNRLKGSIPSTLGNLANLQELYFYGNQLSGTIPSELGNLTKLTILNLGNNQLAGEIPYDLGKLTALESLYLFQNSLAGNIPSSITKLPKLTSLYLNDNQLSGTVPDFSNIPDSGTIYIDNNYFTFNGIESNAPKLDGYAPQKTQLKINRNGKTLSVTAGGTLSKNQYFWFRNGQVLLYKTGDSTFTVTDDGAYRVQVNNTVASSLGLLSDIYNFSNTPLPVTLVNFSAKKTEKGNLIFWSTTSETNNSGFEIERSSDAKSFISIATLDGKGNSKSSNNYQFTDVNPLPDNYYRLKQIDYDGTSAYSRMIYVDWGTNTLKVYPNPAKGDFILESSDINSPATLYNLQGQKLIEKEGAGLHSFKTDEMSSGTYILKVGKSSTKVVLEK
ncbi:MAG: leucine-rich repeat domain-containing protein [Dyadobacter sp.]